VLGNFEEETGYRKLPHPTTEVHMKSYDPSLVVLRDACSVERVRCSASKIGVCKVKLDIAHRRRVGLGLVE
jgi:hypothetical protein